MNTDGIIISQAEVCDSFYVATGTFKDDKRFAILKKAGDLITTTGEYEVTAEEESIPFYIKGIVYQSTMTSQTHTNRFAVATRLGGILGIYEFNLSLQTITQTKEAINLFAPHFSVKAIQGTFNFIPDIGTRWGYLYLTSDSKYIYALYSGLYQQQGEPFTSGNTVHVFNWDGKPICQIILDRRIIDLAVSKDMLYGLHENSDRGYELIEYELSF